MSWCNDWLSSCHLLFLRGCDGRHVLSDDRSQRSEQQWVQDTGVHQNVLLITQTRSDRELPQHQLQREDEERLPVQEEGHAEEHPRRAQVSLTLFWWCVMLFDHNIHVSWCINSKTLVHHDFFFKYFVYVCYYVFFRVIIV